MSYHGNGQLGMQVRGGGPGGQGGGGGGGRKHRHEDEEMGKLFVGGLSWDTTQETLLRYFGRFGECIDCVVMKNSETGRSRGFGFVTFADPNNIDAVLASGPHTLDGRTIDPKACNPRSMQKPKKSTSTLNFPKVFLGGLPSNVTETELRTYFAQYGEVMEVVIMYDQEKKKSRGFGFLSFVDEDACCKAVADHFVTIQNKQVEIKRAEPRSNQAHGDRGGLDGAPLEQWGAPPLMANGHQPGHPHMLAGQPVAHHNPPPPASPYATWGAPQGPPAQQVAPQPQPTAYPTQYGPAQPQVHHVQGPPPSGWGQPPPVAVQAPPHAAAPAQHWGAPHMQTYASPPPAATPQPAPQYQTVYPAVPAAAAPQQHPSAAQQYWGPAPAPGDPYAAQPRSDPYAAYVAPPAAAPPQPGAPVAYPYPQYHPHAAMVAAAQQQAKAPMQPAYAGGPPAGEYYAPATSPPVGYPGAMAPAPADLSAAGGLGPQRPAYGTQPSPYHPYRRT